MGCPCCGSSRPGLFPRKGGIQAIGTSSIFWMPTFVAGALQGPPHRPVPWAPPGWRSARPGKEAKEGVRSLLSAPLYVIPAKAGSQLFFLDSCLRRNDTGASSPDTVPPVERKKDQSSFGDLDFIHREQRPPSVVFDPIFRPYIG